MTDLSKSKNAIVAPYYLAFESGYFHSKEHMLEELAEELLAKVENYEEQEALNVSPITGTFVLHMPIQYMVENAKEKEKKVYSAYQEQLTKINKGETVAMILPALTDENGNRMFTLEYVGPTVCGV